MADTPPSKPNIAPISTNLSTVPSNIPVSWLATISSLAGVITFGVIPAIHHYFPEIPTLDVTVVQASLGMLISLAIVIHNYGLKVAVNFLMTNLAPQIIQAVAAQIQHNNSVGPLSIEDVVAIKHSRYNRSMDKTL